MIKAAKIGPRSLDQNISAHILVQCHNILRETIHVTDKLELLLFKLSLNQDLFGTFFLYCGVKQ